MIFKKEAKFEDALIKVLFNKGWSSEVIMYPTEEDLIQNWANILFNNNQSIDRLNGCPLTSGEMQQIMDLYREWFQKNEITEEEVQEWKWGVSDRKETME